MRTGGHRDGGRATTIVATTITCVFPPVVVRGRDGGDVLTYAYLGSSRQREEVGRGTNDGDGYGCTYVRRDPGGHRGPLFLSRTLRR